MAEDCLPLELFEGPLTGKLTLMNKKSASGTDPNVTPRPSEIRHSRASGNLITRSHCKIPAYAGMTFKSVCSWPKIASGKQYASVCFGIKRLRCLPVLEIRNKYRLYITRMFFRLMLSQSIQILLTFCCHAFAIHKN